MADKSIATNPGLHRYGMRILPTKSLFDRRQSLMARQLHQHPALEFAGNLALTSGGVPISPPTGVQDNPAPNRTGVVPVGRASGLVLILTGLGAATYVPASM